MMIKNIEHTAFHPFTSIKKQTLKENLLGLLELDSPDVKADQYILRFETLMRELWSLTFSERDNRIALKRDEIGLLIPHRPDFNLFDLMIWDRTDEGYDFWNNLHVRYQRYIKDRMVLTVPPILIEIDLSHMKIPIIRRAVTHDIFAPQREVATALHQVKADLKIEESKEESVKLTDDGWEIVD